MGERRWEASEWLALAVLAVGALVWVGYFTHSPWMERLQPGEANANMTAATAATLLLAGWSLLLSPRRRWVTLVPLLALSVAGLWRTSPIRRCRLIWPLGRRGDRATLCIPAACRR